MSEDDVWALEDAYVTAALLEDVRPMNVIPKHIAVELNRTLTREQFGEDWRSPQAELEWLELGRRVDWDYPIWLDDCDG